jgi:D-alanyl-D-alanine carboxypeptidase (penicillin-binding protein 5/6)
VYFYMKVVSRFILAVVIPCIGLVLAVFDAAAAPIVVRSDVPPPELTAESWVLLDFGSGAVIAEHNADLSIEPASLTKVMLTYVVFGKLERGELGITDEVYISEKAWRTEGSRMFVEVDTNVTVGDLLKGVIIQSGNDAAVALAEHIGGSEPGFASLMNVAARKLGMKSSNFLNAPGLPDEAHVSSARDIAILSAAMIREFPEYYRWYAEPEFTYNEITQQNRNILLSRDKTVDGVKTGHTESAGYCLAGSALRDGTRLIAVVTGTDGAVRRANEVQALLNYGYSNYQSVELFGDYGGVVQSRVYKGAGDEVTLGMHEPYHVVVPIEKVGQIDTRIESEKFYVAPIESGQVLGRAVVMVGETEISEVPLVALNPVAEGGFFKSLVDMGWMWFE